MSSESYNGWVNRETWAFVLHCDNTVGAEFIVGSLGVSSEDDGYWSASHVGQLVVEFVTDLWDESTGAEWVELMRSDVGSVWRLDELAIGEWAIELAKEMSPSE